MSKAILDESLVRAWVDQFDIADRGNAATLASLIRLIPGDQFRRDLTACLNERFADGATPIALYNESERGKWKGRPNRLFPEKSHASKKRKGEKTVRAWGTAGPSLVPRHRQVAEEVGSEGVVANILTQFQRSHRKSVLLSPGPDIIREQRVRRFILVTDFIGSGDRVTSYLNSAWRIRSVRSWWSRRNSRGLNIEVVAYAGTEAGVAQVKKHMSAPLVTLVAQCPTISSVFPSAQSKVMTRLCEQYATTGSKPLGYGESGVLLAFDHGMPNNAPAIFWKSARNWSAFIPARATIAFNSPFHTTKTEEQERVRIEASARASTVGQPMAPVNLETIVLSALRRSPRHPQALSGRLGLNIEDVIRLLSRLEKWGWINDAHQLTERGRAVASRLIRQDRKRSLPIPKSNMYFPDALRAPRNV